MNNSAKRIALLSSLELFSASHISSWVSTNLQGKAGSPRNQLTRAFLRKGDEYGLFEELKP
jgi:hypothetical protein